MSRDSQGLLVSVFLSQSHLTCNAQPMISRFRIPKPANSSGLCTFSQATRQQPPCTSRLPFQRKALRILLIALMNHLGTFNAIRTCIGRAEITNRTQVARPAMFIRLAFQLGNLSPILSTQGKRSIFLSFLSDIGRPK